MLGIFAKKIKTDSKDDSAAALAAGGETISVQTIPADFYGGVNPVVKFKTVEKEVELQSRPKLTASEKKMLDKSTAASSKSLFHPINILTNKKSAVIFGLLLFAVIAAGAGVYYYLQIKQQTKIALPQSPQISAVTTTDTVPPVTESTTTLETAPTSTPPSLAEAPIEFPSVLLGDSPDLDKDNLTDAAEELFGTDPSKPDTDEDIYSDGHEVFYLYNPAGKEPIRLISSGAINDYENPVFGYKVFYPVSWAIGSVDDSYRDILFSTISGENVELRTFDLSSGETFADWFAKMAPAEQYGNLADFQTYFQQPGKNRNDNLVYYFTDENHVYALIYHTTDSNVVNYRSIMVMMARSFRVPGFVPPEIAPPVPENSGFPDEMPATVNAQ